MGVMLCTSGWLWISWSHSNIHGASVSYSSVGLVPSPSNDWHVQTFAIHVRTLSISPSAFCRESSAAETQSPKDQAVCLLRGPLTVIPLLLRGPLWTFPFDFVDVAGIPGSSKHSVGWYSSS